MIIVSDFPTTVWDGLTSSRLRADQYSRPTAEDYAEIVAEVAAVQTHLKELKDADKIVRLAPAVAANVDPVTNYINDHLKIVTKDIILAIGASAVASVDLGYDIPVGSIVLAAALNIETAITLATATKIGLGIAGSLAKYGTITGGTKNNKSTLGITPTAIGSAEDLKVYATDNSSAAAGTIQNGTIRVRLTLLTQTALEDAA